MRSEPTSGPRRPVVLLLVFGIFLALIGITAMAQAILVSADYTTGILSSIAANDAATVRTFVNSNLTASDLDPTTSRDRSGVHTQQLQALLARGEILRAELRAPDGTILQSDVAGLVGTRAAVTTAFAVALAGTPSVAVSDSVVDAEASGDALASVQVLREYLPISAAGEVRAVIAVWRDAQPILDRVDATRRNIVIVTLSAGLIAASILFLVFRGAQGRITRQTRQLVEATRRDALTGLLNHGSMVAELTRTLEETRAEDGAVVIGLVDIDNFRLLNDTHGHAAGDEALLAVARTLKREAGPDIRCGRYGPDEFLLIAPARLAAELEPALTRCVAALVHFSLQYEATERLPVTLSAALASYPHDATSVTELLSTAATRLAEAKASGGNTTLVTQRHREGKTDHSAFTVLQGLIIAVDTKDRYTKRHSEDVARYALFLADQLDLDIELRDTLRLAGLLHDVGKIGIPDELLRKPAQLSAAEQAVVAQHVALGDAIVRNLPNVDLIRAGVRFHHERWDGRGYLDHLSGQEIPLIARLLAVGDTFSAMTTTRPYRKALSTEEALRRLGDAAGTQLDETLVRAFITGIETAANPPLPGEDVGRTTLWRPTLRVA